MLAIAQYLWNGGSNSFLSVAMLDPARHEFGRSGVLHFSTLLSMRHRGTDFTLGLTKGSHNATRCDLFHLAAVLQ